MSISKATTGLGADLLLVDGSTAVLNLLSGAAGGTAFAKTGGVGNTWPGDSSNFRTLLGASAPVIAQATDNLEPNADAIFSPWGSVAWAATGTGAIAAEASGEYGSSSMKITCGATATDGAVLATAAVAAAAYTCSCRVKANNAGAVGKSVIVTYDTTSSAALVLTANWQTLKVTDASASGTTPNASVTFTDGANTDEVLVSAWQRESGSVQTPFCLNSRTACTMTIPTATIGLTAGQPLSMMFVVNTPWSDSTVGEEYLFLNRASGNDTIGLRLRDDTGGLNFFVLSGGVTRSATLDLTNKWAANQTHIVFLTLAANADYGLYADGVGKTGNIVARETAMASTNYIGKWIDGWSHLNGSVLSAMWGRVLSAGEIAALSALASWGTLTDITISGLATGNAARVYNGETVVDSGVETAGVATLTPAGPHAERKLRVFEDDSYVTQIDELIGV
jgi:hypothetical protein